MRKRKKFKVAASNETNTSSSLPSASSPSPPSTHQSITLTPLEFPSPVVILTSDLVDAAASSPLSSIQGASTSHQQQQILQQQQLQQQTTIRDISSTGGVMTGYLNIFFSNLVGPMFFKKFYFQILQIL